MQLEPLVAHNFAKALFNVAQKAQIPLDYAYQEAEALERLLIEQSKFFHFLVGPQFREHDKETVVTKVLKGKVEDIFFNFILMVLRHNRPEYLPDILDEFKVLIERSQGIIPCSVTTAITLSEEGQGLLKEKLEAFCGKKFHLEFKVDPKVIGGVTVKYGDTLIDTSISTYLYDLRQSLENVRLAS